MRDDYLSENYVRVVNASGTFDNRYVYHNGQLVAQNIKRHRPACGAFLACKEQVKNTLNPRYAYIFVPRTSLSISSTPATEATLGFEEMKFRQAMNSGSTGRSFIHLHAQLVYCARGDGLMETFHQGKLLLHRGDHQVRHEITFQKVRNLAELPVEHVGEKSLQVRQEGLLGAVSVRVRGVAAGRKVEHKGACRGFRHRNPNERGPRRSQWSDRRRMSVADITRIPIPGRFTQVAAQIGTVHAGACSCR
jgi:hypothetical protein